MLASAFSAALVAAFCVGRVAAHGGVTAYSNGGNFYPGWRACNTPVGQTTIGRPYDTFDPIESVSAPTLACNNDGNSGPNQLVATGTWPHDTGPVITYPAKCPRTTCTGVNANGLKWFKIDEAGLLSGTVNSGTWAAKKMITDNSTWTSTIPASAPSGPYLIRHETIALHSMPAQHYPECAELLITDGGNLEPTPDELVTPVG
ncbi:glycoside hydrolase [Coprinellus micaceus]|uniref:AA9 family lytic polysaccharide monooxygenase n=1 Tax=Coprinellus micaceus TaxID=71717 RepID=A0A4Y7SL23_COPMI|nr:glycoside hydrolase [Coprinellus micaceus]